MVNLGKQKPPSLSTNIHYSLKRFDYLEQLSMLATRKRNSVARLTRNSKIFKTIIHAIQQKKGNNIVSLDLRKIPEAVTDFFVICEASNTTQVKANGTSSIVVALNKFTIPDAKYLAVQIMEKNGGRHLFMKVSNNKIMKAITLPDLR